ncbi:DNA repair protein RadC [Vibrio fluvialis]
MRENNYYFDGPVTAARVLDAAAEILAARALRGDQYCNPDATKTYLSCKLKYHEREVFAVMFLDNQHRLIAFEELFFGTIDSASVYPREVLKAALKANAAAVIFAHNHPSGDATPSHADKQITQRLKEALALVDIRVLDHIVVGDSAISFAERGLL